LKKVGLFWPPALEEHGVITADGQRVLILDAAGFAALAEPIET